MVSHSAAPEWTGKSVEPQQTKATHTPEEWWGFGEFYPSRRSKKGQAWALRRCPCDSQKAVLISHTWTALPSVILSGHIAASMYLLLFLLEKSPPAFHSSDRALTLALAFWKLLSHPKCSTSGWSHLPQHYTLLPRWHQSPRTPPRSPRGQPNYPLKLWPPL